MIQTVMGKVVDLGTTMSHEHLMIDLRRVRKDDESYILDVDTVCNELFKAKALGLESIIELTCNDMGRDVRKLQEISKKTGIHIVCSTGFYLKEYHSKQVIEASQEEIEDIFANDLIQGIDGTQIKAGIIGEIGCSKEQIYDSERKVLLAAGVTSKKLNVAVSTHCDMGQLALEQIACLWKTGMNPEKIIIGHTDLVDDSNYHASIVKSHANIAFDTIGKSSYLSDEKRAENLCRLLEKGYEDNIVLSQDVSRKSYLTNNGGYGYTAVLGSFIDTLKHFGVSDFELKKMLVLNPKRILERED